jgi:hypothetical protein
LLVLIALAIVCLAIALLLLGKSPRRIFPGSGSLLWRGRQLSEEEAAQMVRDRLDAHK